MDMASKWLGGVSYDEMDSAYEDFFFGYATWDFETKSIVDFQIYSLDMQNEEWNLTDEDIKLIKDYITANAPSFMGEG